jgi:hypothetical protein
MASKGASNGKVDPLKEIARLKRLEDETDELLVKAVRLARVHGLSWYKIGPALGISRQGAEKRYKGRV